jgi:hypothetical protein
MRYLIAALVLASSLAYGQTLTNAQKISWPAATQYTNGTAIPTTVAVTYNVYAKLAGAAEVKLMTGVAATSVTSALYPAGQSNCYTISVLLNGANESARSPEACGVVQSPSAKPVTTVVIQ